MPHPRKHLKRTGDTHPPEVENDLVVEKPTMQDTWPGANAPRDSAAGSAAGMTGAGASRPEGMLPMRLSEPTERYLDAAREQVRRKPLKAAGVAFAAGFLLAIITR